MTLRPLTTESRKGRDYFSRYNPCLIALIIEHKRRYPEIQFHIKTDNKSKDHKENA